MKLGIIGLPNSGKTTIFNALTRGSLPTGAATSGQFEVHTAVVNVPDVRVDKLKAMYKPKKTTYTQVTYVDIGGLDKGIGEGGLGGQFRNQLAQLDGFLHVVRTFKDEGVPHPYDSVDAARDVAILDSEFILTDLVAIEGRLERLDVDLKRKGKAGDPVLSAEKDLLERMKAHLEADRPLRDLDLTEEEIKPLRGFGFLTLKPALIVLNADEASGDAALSYDHRLSRIVTLQGRIEAELSQLEPEDAEIFMAEYGITELSAAKVIRLSYELLNIQSFFTVGEDEVRAWDVRIGATAPEAAGVIHSDLQKGFIRAEVMAYSDLIAAGSEVALKTAGKFRLEGKDYIVKDGDIVHIRFNL
ncbi:MAG: redox-regulated ATPase YchF [Anaerolineae bacterium]|nr:redox-regulated ATPase YchF [Anaerolineae bacterium]NUQ03336.1 redox-regulated ATPase YchF [Anaerolineae bacterium]